MRHCGIKGFSLTEAVVVLAIGGAVIGGVMAAYGAHRENREVSGIVRDVLYVAAGLAEKYPASSFPEDGSGVSADGEVAASGSLPQAWQYDGSDLVEPYDTVSVAEFFRYGTQYAGTASWAGAFKLVFSSVKPSVCVKVINALVPLVYKEDSLIRWLEVREGGGSTVYDRENIHGSPYDPEECRDANNTISIVFAH